MSERDRKFGLDDGDVELLNEWGEGVCWICQEPESIPGRSLAVDHCHEIGTVRGLLCGRCNNVLGRMKDRADWLRRAADYIERTKAMYSDICTACPAEEAKTYPWSEVVETDQSWTTFRYRCDHGHVWTCGYRTVGAMWMWS